MKRSAPLRRTSRRRPPMDADVYETVMRRAGGQCEIGETAPGACWGDPHWHHRLTRALGGQDEVANGIAPCAFHHAWMHSHPLFSIGQGWLIGRRDSRAPSEIPVLLAAGFVLLTDHGTYLEASS